MVQVRILAAERPFRSGAKITTRPPASTVDINSHGAAMAEFIILWLSRGAMGLGEPQPGGRLAGEQQIDAETLAEAAAP